MFMEYKYIRVFANTLCGRIRRGCYICCISCWSRTRFSWFNSYPAEIFMGDCGSLSLGSSLGLLAIILKQELAFAIMSGIFIAEVLSVIIQVTSFKMRNGKRVFKMAPLHHHYELSGLSEPKIIMRFWIVTFILVLIALSTLKIR